jgi:hypothetical protein
MKHSILFILLFLVVFEAHAKFEVSTSSGYASGSDGKTNNSFSDMTNHIFLGASVDSKEKLIIGQNISLVSSQIKTTNTDKLSTTELGPKITYYFNDDKNFYVGVAWNPYAKGTRTAAGVSADISGWSYLATTGVLMKMSGNFLLGASINYHSLSVTKAIVSTTASTVSNSYSSIMPMINICFRFK